MAGGKTWNGSLVRTNLTHESNPNASVGAVSLLHILGLITLFALLLESCASSRYSGREFRECCDQSNGNAIRLLAELNSADFAASALRRSLGSGRSSLLFDRPRSTFESGSTPYVKLGMVNLTNDTLRVPVNYLCESLESGRPKGWSISRLDFSIGRECLINAVAIAVATYRDEYYNVGGQFARDDFYGRVCPGDTIWLGHEIDLLGLFRSVDIRPGRSWLRISIYSTVWEESLPQVWLGEATSDTLWYTVSEE